MTEPTDLAAWRKAQRAALIEGRKAISPEERLRADERISTLLQLGFPMLEHLAIGFYWPFNGEVDPRVAVHRFRTKGARTALPVVVAKGAALQFRAWRPGVPTVPGVFGLPVPQSEVIIPEVLLMPPVGFDGGGYRLGYGGGYFDRTLAAAAPQPLKIGLAREASRIDTIHPQSHDVPMDFVITERGVHEVVNGRLQAQEDLTMVAARAALLMQERRPMGDAELAALLNTLLEAERAGAKVVAAFLSEQSIAARGTTTLLPIQRDESRNCVVLVGLLRHIGAEPSRATGHFLQLALAVQGERERLVFLNRGQAWVARRIGSALPRITDPRVREQLQEMRESHLANIRACEELIEEEAA